MHKRLGMIAVLILTMSAPAFAQIREIRTTGEFRMGDNDTRADARRLALLDAKRKALDEAGTYLESVSEVKLLQLTKDEISAYSAGIMQVTEEGMRQTQDGDTTVIHVDVRVRIDTGDMVRRIDSLRQDQKASSELLEMRRQIQQLQEQLDKQNRTLANLTSKADVDKATQERKEMLEEVDQQQETRRVFTEGITALKAKNYVEAIRSFQIAAEKDPTQHVIFANLGEAFAGARRYDEAVAAYRKAIELKPDEFAYYNNMGIALGNSGRLDEAAKAFATGSQVDPSFGAQAYFNLGAILVNRGRSREAINAFKKAIEFNPAMAQAYYQLGVAYFGDPATVVQAISVLETFLKLEPNGPSADAARALLRAAREK